MFRINELKKLLHKTNQQIADDLNLSTSTINSWTSGVRTPHRSRIQQMENLYGLNPGWLTDDTDETHPFTTTDYRRKQVKEIMTCQSEFAIDTVCRLAEATESEWETIEKILK